MQIKFISILNVFKPPDISLLLNVDMYCFKLYLNIKKIFLNKDDITIIFIQNVLPYLSQKYKTKTKSKIILQLYLFSLYIMNESPMKEKQITHILCNFCQLKI